MTDRTVRTLLVNTYDIAGGAARAVYRLHEGLLGIGVSSKLLVKEKHSDNFTVEIAGQKETDFVERFRSIIAGYFFRKMRRTTNIPLRFSPVPDYARITDLEGEIVKFLPDIVHLNWICNDYLSLSDIGTIHKPVVWTLHDSWAFTGGCHIPGTCLLYRENCGRCPLINSTDENDLSRLIHEKKVANFSGLDLTVVAPSRWLGDCARSSSLFRNHRVEVIPNGLDTNVFRPTEMSKAREMLGLPHDKKLVLFGAVSSSGDVNKGFQYLDSALSYSLSQGYLDNCELLIFGESIPENPPDLGLPTHYLGRIHDDIALVLIYSAADVMVVPSLQEAFCQTASESMSCGTPVVAFASTGLLDIVDHKLNGYLAHPFQADDLAFGIKWVLENESSCDLSLYARRKAEQAFSIETVANRYLELYTELITRG